MCPTPVTPAPAILPLASCSSLPQLCSLPNQLPCLNVTCPTPENIHTCNSCPLLIPKSSSPQVDLGLPHDLPRPGLVLPLRASVYPAESSLNLHPAGPLLKLLLLPLSLLPDVLTRDRSAFFFGVHPLSLRGLAGVHSWENLPWDLRPAPAFWPALGFRGLCRQTGMCLTPFNSVTSDT